MTAEMIEAEIKNLEEQRKALEIDYHRIGGAIAAYQYMLEQVRKKPADPGAEVQNEPDKQ